MTFLEWLRDKGYNVYDSWDIQSMFDAVEADILWQEWDAQNYEKEIKGE